MTTIKTVLLTASLISVFSTNRSSAFSANGSGQLYLFENKGQVTDQHRNPRNDIQFVIPAPGISIFIGNGQLHYQFSHTTMSGTDLPGRVLADLKNGRQSAGDKATVDAYRMDVELVDANMNAVAEVSDRQQYYENYYLPGCPDGVQAHTSRRVTYRDIYPGIDWVIYIKNNQLEHEFVIGPGGNPADIRIRYSGQSSLKVNNDGSLTAITPMGVIKEQAPICLTRNGGKAGATYRLDGNILTYTVKATGQFTIDPVLEWGTYYGPDSNNTSQYGIVCDNNGKVFTSGLTYAATTANVATTGSYQATYGGACDAFMIKFDSSGNRLWATYYGGADGDWSNGLALDNAGNIYMVGTTASTSVIASSGAQQTTFGGGWDGFIAKFDATGMRVWGSYAGGTGLDYPQSIACDTQGHVYMAGAADSYTNIATPGSFKPTHGGGHDDFLIQYNTSSGVRMWGTYIGGNGDDFGGVVSSDGFYAYITGFTTSTTGITTPSTHQPVLAGTSDAFLMKFFPSGIQVWGTYFGGADPESTGGLAVFGGYVYLFGSTNSTTGISTSGAYQPSYAGTVDAFLARFNPDAGTVMWATYFGGPGTETVDKARIVATKIGDVFVTGYTASTTGIASPTGAWQPTYGGGDNDAFLAKFNSGGSLYWSSYYGGSGEDEGRGCAFDGENAYIAGQTNSSDNIATPGSFLDAGGGHTFYFQSAIAKILINDTLIPSLGVTNTQGAALAVYPNPSTGTFMISGFGSDEHSATVTVTDAAGRIVFNEQMPITSGRLTAVTLPAVTPAGVYLLKAATAHGTLTARLVKETRN